ncbi:MAG: uroporphyrinogen-III synthase [Gemmatimonadales bacterium]
MRDPRVVITLSPGALPGLVEALGEAGASVRRVPLLHFEEPAEWGPVDDALRRLDEFAAIALTSPRAAQAFGARLARLLQSHRPAGRVPTPWALGRATAEALGGAFGPVRLASPDPLSGEARAGQLARELIAAGVGSPVLFPCGDPHRGELPDNLRSAGVEVVEITVYRSSLADRAAVEAVWADADFIVAGSPRVVHLLTDAGQPGERPGLIAIGATTADAASRRGWPARAVAETPTVKGLVAAVLTCLHSSSMRTHSGGRLSPLT